MLTLYYSFRGEGFVRMNAMWKRVSYFFVNIYASCNPVSRRTLWRTLANRKLNNIRGDWLLGETSILLFIRRRG